MTAQKLRKKYSDSMELALNYYKVICIMNSIPLTNRELQLLAFTAVRGAITNPAAKKDFCEIYKSSIATINNMISSLKNHGIFVKDSNRIKIHPALTLDFTNSILIQIHFEKSQG